VTGLCRDELLFPVVVGALAESGDSVANVLFSHVRLTLFNQIDDALMRFNVLTPDGRILT
jgi:hypothetical protein